MRKIVYEFFYEGDLGLVSEVGQIMGNLLIFETGCNGKKIMHEFSFSRVYWLCFREG